MGYRPRRGHLLILLGVLIVGVIGLYGFAGQYGFGMIARGRISYWQSIGNDDPELPEPMRQVLSAHAPSVTAAAFEWRNAGPGIDVTELPVMAGTQAVDRLFLTRLDPKLYRFVVANAPLGTTDIDHWQASLGAVAVVNGSYFARSGQPDTPFISEGKPLGPTSYDATQGAFVADNDVASIRDLSNQPWQTAFQGATNALVSYPLLVRPDGAANTIKESRWLANRTFVAQDGEGRIILGTSASAFFTLHALSDFLGSAPLDIKTALNLDGGPVACQAVATASFHRSVCGQWEIQAHDGDNEILRWTGSQRWGLPIVLAAIPKTPRPSR